MVRWQYLEGRGSFRVGIVLTISFCRMYCDKYQLEFEKLYDLNDLGNEGWNLVDRLTLENGEYHLTFKRSA